MHRSSESIGAIAAALAKAQGELTNPEKSLTATIRSSLPHEGDRTFRYASLASGLDIVRKSLGQHEIATVQTTAIDPQSGQITLTTLLAHASGEWISSDWPVCPTSEMTAPHRMGAALTYARRYALFALVGIAGEDDLDAPDILTATLNPANDADPTAPTGRMRRSIHKPKPVLVAEPSAALRDQLIAEMQNLKSGEEMALWAHKRLPAKNTLTTDDARAVETACQAVLGALNADELGQFGAPGPIPATTGPDSAASSMTAAPVLEDQSSQALVTPLRKSMRRRNKAHLAFVASQPCLVCQRSPCDAHHLKFAQPRSLGLKVSDEFTVPLCREHHHELHRHGNEMAWWANLQIDALKEAKELWAATLLQADPARKTIEIANKRPGKIDPASDAESIVSRNSVGRTSP
jgi:ERF superfamily